MKYTFQEYYGGKDHPVEYETMLKAMKDQRIFEVEHKDTGFEISECCDGCFGVRLTPEQLKELGEELIALAHTPNKEVSDRRAAGLSNANPNANPPFAGPTR